MTWQLFLLQSLNIILYYNMFLKVKIIMLLDVNPVVYYEMLLFVGIVILKDEAIILFIIFPCVTLLL